MAPWVLERDRGVSLTEPDPPTEPLSASEPKDEVESSGPELDGALEALFAEALELQDQRKKADDRESLDALIAEQYGGDEEQHDIFDDEDPDLALPDLPEDDLVDTVGIDPEVVERLEAELTMLKQQKRTLHEQMAQRSARFESNEARIVQLEQQLVASSRQAKAVARDFENYRARQERDRATQKLAATEKLLKSFLGVYDNLSRALEHAEDRDSPLGQGVEMTLGQFLATLRSGGAEQVVCERGTPFDPAFHEAMAQVHDDEVPAGGVVDVMQTGFQLGERLLRAAMVSVSQGPAPTAASSAASGQQAEEVAEEKKTEAAEEEQAEATSELAPKKKKKKKKKKRDSGKKSTASADQKDSDS